MTALTETKTKCLKCKKKTSYFGSSKASVLVKNMYLALCQKCTEDTVEFITGKRSLDYKDLVPKK